MKTAYWPYVLIKGHTDDASTGACAMAAVSWLMHGKHSDRPECACPVLTSFIIPANDAMPADVRQRFLPYLHRIAGSRSEEHEAARTRILWLAAVRIFAPIALDQSGLHTEAEKLRALPDDVSAEAAKTAAKAETAWAAAKAVKTAWAAKAEEAAWAACAAAETAAAKAAETAAKTAWAAGTAETAAWAAETAAAAAGTAGTAAWAAETAAKAAETAAWAAAETAETAAAKAAWAAAKAAWAAAETAAETACAAARHANTVWDAYFAVLDEALSAGPQGEPWSADVMERAIADHPMTSR